MKKLLTGIAVFITMAVLCVFSAGAETFGDFRYELLENGTVEITDYLGGAEKLTIPSQIDGKKVTAIGAYAFEECNSLVSVTIPASVTDIGNYAFYYCESLESVAISGNVTRIGNKAFGNCNALSSISIPESVTSIGDEAFLNCDSLVSITIPKNVRDIGEFAFYKCSALTSVTICDGVTYISDFAFTYCSSLESITIPDSVTAIGIRAFLGCSSLKAITIPEKVTSIGINAFEACTSLTSITIPKSVRDIGEFAFFNCSALKSATICNGITYISNFAFADCAALESVTIPDSVTTIGVRAFYQCYSLKTVTIPDSVKVINNYAFIGCTSLTSITIPDSVTDIGAAAFCNCKSLATATIPDSVIRIGEDAFSQCGVLVIECFKDSCAEEYAISEGISYKVITPYITGFKLSSRNYNSITLSWNKRNNVTGYIIEQYKNGAWTEIAKITSNATTSYKVTGLSAGTKYQFRMKAYKTYASSTLYSDYTAIGYFATRPSNVTGFGTKTRGANYITIGWNKNDSATGYIIEQYIDGSWVQIADITDSSTTTYKVTELVPGTAYKFRMRAYDEDAEGKNTEALTVSTLMTAVKGFRSPSKSTTAIRLNWTMNAYADGYLIEQYTNDGWVQIADITDGATTTYKVTGLKSGTAYKFRMKAYSVTENDEIILGSKTATLTVNTQASSVSGFALKSRSSTALRLKWAKNTAVDGYAIEQMIDGVWTEIADIDSYKTTEYKVTGLTAATSYEFRMRAYAVTKYGEKTYSAYTSVLTKTTSPSAVSGLRVKSKAQTAIRIAWTANELVDGYSIEMYIDGEWTLCAEASGTATELKVTGLKSATEYQFRIRAYVLADDTVLYSGYKTVSGMTL